MALFAPLHTVFKLNPAVKPDVRAFLGYRIPKLGCIFFVAFRLVHNVYGVTRPLLVGYNLAGYHIRLAAICFKGIYVFLYFL